MSGTGLRRSWVGLERGMVVVAVVSVCSEHGIRGTELQHLVQAVMSVSYLWLLVLASGVW